MTMHNPPHPGEFITEVYLEPNNLSGRELAGKLDVSASTLNRILKGTSGISPKWPFAFQKRSVALRRVGSPCSTTMTCGTPGNTSSSKGLGGFGLPRSNPSLVPMPALSGGLRGETAGGRGQFCVQPICRR